MFGREFHIEDVLVLWDGIFAHDQHLSLVDHICVAMLIYLRSHCRTFCLSYLVTYAVFGQEYSLCLRRLFKYPPVEDVHLFIEKAMLLAKNKPLPIPKVLAQHSVDT